MAQPPPIPAGATTPGTTLGSPAAPPSGQTSKLAANLAAKATGKKSSPPPLLTRPGTTGGRRTVAEESAAHLQRAGLVAVPIGSADGAGLGPVQPPPYVVSPEFVKDFSVTLFKGIEEWRVSQRYLRVKIMAGEEKLAKEFADASKAPPGCIESMGRSVEELAKKYPGMLQWAPELALVLCLGNWVQKDLSIEKKLDALEARLKEQLANAAPRPAPGIVTQGKP